MPHASFQSSVEIIILKILINELHPPKGDEASIIFSTCMLIHFLHWKEKNDPQSADCVYKPDCERGSKANFSKEKTGLPPQVKQGETDLIAQEKSQW